MLKHNKNCRLMIILLVMIFASLLSAQSSASHAIIIRVIGRVAFSSDNQSDAFDSSSKQPLNIQESKNHQQANLRWEKMYENQKVSIHIKNDKELDPLKIKMMESQGCDARNSIQLSGNAQELLTTSTNRAGLYSWTLTENPKRNDQICVVYTVTST